MQQIELTIDGRQCLAMLTAAITKRLQCRGWSVEQSYTELDKVTRIAACRLEAAIEEAVEDVANLAAVVYDGEPPPERVMVTALAVFALRGIEIADQIIAERSN
jgi:hypothetical protein